MATTMARDNEGRGLPAADQAVVDEFAGVILRHRDRSPSSLAELARRAFAHALGSGGTRDAKLERALARGAMARHQLADAEGGSLSSEAVAKLLHLSKTAVIKRLGSGRLLAWREERLNAARFPAWQFDGHGHVLRGLEDVLAILGGDDRLDAWGKVLFFLQEKPGQPGKRPLDLLRAGRIDAARAAAEAYVG